MLYFKGNYQGYRASTIWWPDSIDQIETELENSKVVILWQCPMPLAEKLEGFVCWKREFETPLINLTLSEEELFKRMHPNQCRNQIRKAEKKEFAITCNEDTDAAFTLLNESIRRLKYRHEIGAKEWDGLRKNSDIYLCRHNERPIATHVIMRDKSNRARFLFGGTADRADKSIRSVIGPMNRLLHWKEIQDYKRKGYKFYDFGGINLDPDAPDFSIGQFKLRFGPEVVSEPILYLSRHRMVRFRLGLIGTARSVVDKLSLGESFRSAIRTRPWLARFFR